MEARAVEINPLVVAVFGEPPEGLDLAENTSKMYNIIVSIALGVAVACVCLRLYIRRVKGPNLWLDDYVIIFSTLCSSGSVACTVLAGSYGAGSHIWVNQIPRLKTLLKIVYSESYVYGLTTTATKWSILLFYHRLFYLNKSQRGVFFYLYWLAIIFATVYPMVLWITLANVCSPVSYYWDQYTGAEGSCINLRLFFVLAGIINLLNDVLILIVPIPTILELKLTPRLKASVIGIMMLGGFVCIATIIRIHYLYQLFTKHDASWWLGPATAWSSIEPSVAIISACLPTFAPLFRITRKRQRSAYTASSRADPFSNSRRVMTRNTGRTLQTNYIIDDDEVELTYKVAGGDASLSSRDLDTKSGDLGDERGIIVSTQVTVVSHDREEFARGKLSPIHSPK